MIKGAIFDLDGTLLDSMSIWDTVGETYLRTLDIEPKEDLKKRFQTFTLQQSAQYYKKYYNISLSVNEIIEGINSIIENDYFHMVPLKPGAKEFLNSLKQNHIKMCIATSIDNYLADAVLERCAVRDCFSNIFTCNQVGKGKDNPAIYRIAAEHLRTKKNETIVFEDALFALKTAKQDGFLTAAVYDNHEVNQTELKSISDFYIKDFRDVCQKGALI